MKISVITTTYNRAATLRETIESVQKSILAPFLECEIEHIIYDDASTDGTKELIASLSISNLIYMEGAVNSGPSYGRNRALEKATGEYIFFIDSDDILLQRSLYYFLEAAAAEPQKDWFAADFLRADDSLRYIAGDDYYTWDFKSTQEMLAAIFKGEHFIQSNVFIKKSLIEKSGGFDESMRMIEDLDLYIRFLLAGSLPGFCHHISHLHRIHAGNLSKDVTLEKHKAHIAELEQKYLPELSASGITI